MSLLIGGFIFDQIDQADFTGPFEVLSRVPDAEFLVIGKTRGAVRDARGLILTAEHEIGTAPAVDVLLVPGGNGVNAMMEDDAALDFIRWQAATARIVLSVCTGALICGAAGLLSGRRATTHWASHHLLAGFGAEPVNERVVSDGKFVFAAGVTSGIDASLAVAALLRGPDAARRIQHVRCIELGHSGIGCPDRPGHGRRTRDRTPCGVGLRRIRHVGSAKRLGR